MKELNLRQKLALWSAAVAIATLIPVGAFTVLYVYLGQVKAIDDRLQETCSHFLEMFELHESNPEWLDQHNFLKIFHPGGKPQRFVEVTYTDGRLIYRSDNITPSLITDKQQGFSSQRINNIPVRALVMPVDNIEIYFAIDVSDINKVTKDLGLVYLAVMPFLVAAACLGSQFIVHKALKPVRQLATTAQEISADQLSRRLTVPPTDDEIGLLSSMLNEMFDRLDISFKQANRFSADASHELKTPLTILRSSIEEMLDREDLTRETQASLVSLLEQTTHLAAIIENLLLLSRMDARQFKLDFAAHSIRHLLEECLEDAEIMAEEREIRIEASQIEDLRVRVDKTRFIQIVLNLIDNAIKYNQPDGQVIVKAFADNSRAQPQCIISITNTTSVCLDDSRDQLFERFYRNVHTADIPGHGLGLSIARELARAHGGDLTLVRSDGKFTEFALALPLA